MEMTTAVNVAVQRPSTSPHLPVTAPMRRAAFQAVRSVRRPCLRKFARSRVAFASAAPTGLAHRGVHHSVTSLEADIHAWIEHWNADPQPFTWTTTADEILERLARYLQRIPGGGH